MIEELRDYLIRYGYHETDADKVHDAYYDARGSMDEMAKRASKKFAYADDEEHDYSGELFDCIVQWQRDVGERD